RYPREWCCRVTITSSEGERFQRFTAAPRGDPENPLSLEELRAKFRSLLEGTRYQSRAEGLIEGVARLARMDNVKSLLAEY
ncbi:MAG: MmgE/PrpD family protein, partial [Chloroflexota bacterium]